MTKFDLLINLLYVVTAVGSVTLGVLITLFMNKQVRLAVSAMSSHLPIGNGIALLIMLSTLGIVLLSETLFIAVAGSAFLVAVLATQNYVIARRGEI